MTTLRELQTQIGQINEEKGFHGAEATPEQFRPLYFSTKLLLAVGELGEAAEELRKGRDLAEEYEVDGKPEGAPSEIADTVIRLLDLCEEAEIDLEAVILNKLAYNRTRAFRHGKAF